MDIFNNKERRVICVSNHNEPTLTVGEQYAVIDVEVHSWYTLVTLREFPGRQFNSVLFKELEDLEDLDYRE